MTCLLVRCQHLRPLGEACFAMRRRRAQPGQCALSCHTPRATRFYQTKAMTTSPREVDYDIDDG